MRSSTPPLTPSTSKPPTNNTSSRFTLHPTVSLRAVSERLPFTYTGADFYALCSDAMLKAVTRQASLVDAKIKTLNADPLRASPLTTASFFDHFATPEDIAVMVTEQDFLDAHRELIPSVSAGELAHYERVRASFEGTKETAEKEKEKEKAKVNGTTAPPAAAAPMNTARLGLAGRRTASGASARSAGGKGKGKGKGKAVASSTALDSDDEYDDDAEDGVSVNGYGSGGVRDKGKGKEVVPPIAAAAPFGDGVGSGDDEGLYD